jgi:diacylglycerol O-acyltransferase
MQTGETRWSTRMNAMDALFWTMDKVPDLRSTVGALLLLERPPSRERLREAFARLSFGFARMRQRVVEVPLMLAPPEWVGDRQFDLDYHLRYLAVPAPGTVESLLAALSPLYATSFDHARPLWEAYVAEGLADGRGAVLLKMHHCMVDGVGSSRLLQALLGGRRAGNGVVRPAIERRPTSATALLWRAMLYNVQQGIQAGAQMISAVGDAAREPAPISSRIEGGLRMVAGIGRQLFASRARSPLRRPRSLSRQLSTFEMSLREIDALRASLEATVNDIVLTVVSGAMHRWHASHGADVHELRALVPVNLRTQGESEEGNRIAMLAVSLPVGEPNPLRRLRLVQRRTGEVKADRRAKLYPLVAGAVFRFPLPLAEAIARQQTTSANFLCTNVPGPRQTHRLAGVPIEKVYPYAPLIGDHPLSIGLFSYRDVLYVGLDIDPLGMDDLPRFRAALQEAYTEVLGMARRAPRPARRPAPLRQPPLRSLPRSNGNGNHHPLHPVRAALADTELRAKVEQ